MPEFAHKPAATITVEEETLPSMVSRLVGETRELAVAEVAVYKARFGVTVAAYKTAAIFFAAAGVLALCALIALLVGAIMTLATKTGPGWATLIVVGTVLVIAAVLGLIGKSKLTPVKVTS